MENRSNEHTEQQGLRCSIADTPGARDQVYRLRYAGYFRKGSIDARQDERFSDRFDVTPNHFSFLVRDAAEEAVATVRISVVRQDLGWLESPGGTVFGDHPTFQSLAAEGFVEASRLVFAPQARRDALMQLLGYMAAMADFYEAEWLVACPRMEHAAMYQRLFGFRPMAEPRQYHGVKFETQLLAVRRSELRNFVSQAKPMTKAWGFALANLMAGPPCMCV
jgi:Acetyltransferase (GNAT) domain